MGREQVLTPDAANLHEQGRGKSYREGRETKERKQSIVLIDKIKISEDILKKFGKQTANGVLKKYDPVDLDGRTFRLDGTIDQKGDGEEVTVIVHGVYPTRSDESGESRTMESELFTVIGIVKKDGSRQPTHFMVGSREPDNLLTVAEGAHDTISSLYEYYESKALEVAKS